MTTLGVVVPWDLSASAWSYDTSTTATAAATTTTSRSTKKPLNQSGMESSSSSSSPSCFCLSAYVPQKTVPTNRFFVSQANNSTSTSTTKEEDDTIISYYTTYTDDALAKDLNDLTFQERQTIQYDIHGAAATDDLPNETPDFVETKIQEVLECIDNMPESKDQKWEAWNRVKFLRPSIVKESDHLLLFLRAKRYDAFCAAHMLVRFYESKRSLFGEELLVPRRVTWKDLSDQAKTYILKGVIQMVPSKPLDRPYEINLRYLRKHIWDYQEDPHALIQAIRYTTMGLENDPEVQRKGQNVVVDFRREPNTKSSVLEMIQFMQANVRHMECMPDRNSAFHILMTSEQQGSIFEQTMKAIQGLMSRNNRVRFRFHFGSWMEMRYELRTYGIDFPVDPYHLDDSPLALASGNPFSKHYILQELKRRQELEEAWQAKEKVYQHWSSPIAMYPNPQDILMGRQRNITSTWPGNLKYHQVIQRFAPFYLAAKSRQDKTDMSVQVLQALTSPTENDAPSRFLGRLEDHWEMVDDKEAIGKISQSLRDEARKLRQQNTMLQSTSANRLS